MQIANWGELRRVDIHSRQLSRMADERWELIKRVRGVPFQFGGEEHSGWLPPGAAIPLPTPIVNVLLDVEIRFDGHGYSLCWLSQDGTIGSDLWLESLADAELVAAEDFGIAASQWETPPFPDDGGG